jgi:predicted phosphodiesterase
MRVLAISDIHIDYEQNRSWIQQLSAGEYQQDVLILAGDVCHNMPLLQNCLSGLKEKFRDLFYVPGNHDLWIQDNGWPDSLAKFNAIIDFCKRNEIHVHSHDVISPEGIPLVRVAPLHSWYTRPEEGADSLYLPKPGEDESNRMWSDNYYIRWPASASEFNAGNYFIKLNCAASPGDSGIFVISFSHFVPRTDMMFSENRQLDLERMKKYDRSPQFNFSRVAGSALIEEQIRRISSNIHVYGHQHINRDRVIDGVRYVSHCLGYPEERTRGAVRGIEQGLKTIWESS